MASASRRAQAASSFSFSASRRAISAGSACGSLSSASAASAAGLTGTSGTDLHGATGGTASESAVVAEAQKYVGVPYLWGGTDPAKGLDCSGFTQLVYGNLGIDLPRVSAQQATAGQPVASLAQARPGLAVPDRTSVIDTMTEAFCRAVGTRP